MGKSSCLRGGTGFPRSGDNTHSEPQAFLSLKTQASFSRFLPWPAINASMSSTWYRTFPFFPPRSGRKMRTAFSSLASTKYRPILATLIWYRLARADCPAQTVSVLVKGPSIFREIASSKREYSPTIHKACSTVSGHFPKPCSKAVSKGFLSVIRVMPGLLPACVLPTTSEPWQGHSVERNGVFSWWRHRHKSTAFRHGSAFGPCYGKHPRLEQVRMQ